MALSERVAVLVSGGLDSAVLLVSLAESASVTPIYVRCGFAWEADEQRALEAFLAAVSRPSIAAPVTLEMPVASIYGATHWSMTGRDVPGYDAPDSEVYLPGRNLLLIGLAAVWCTVHDTGRIAIGSLAGNPFPDATPAFFRDYGMLMSRALRSPIEVIAPFRGRHKWELVASHSDLPLELTLTCMAPRGGAHCGACNKCHERKAAFVRAGVVDRTVYLPSARDVAYVP